MANKTIDQLTAAAAALKTHEYEVYDPAGSPKSQKVTGTQIVALLAAQRSNHAFTDYFSFPTGAGTTSWTNTTGHDIWVTVSADFDMFAGNAEYMQFSSTGVQSKAGCLGGLIGDIGNFTLNISCFVKAGAGFEIDLNDDAGTVGNWAGQVVLL